MIREPELSRRDRCLCEHASLLIGCVFTFETSATVSICTYYRSYRFDSKVKLSEQHGVGTKEETCIVHSPFGARIYLFSGNETVVLGFYEL